MYVTFINQSLIQWGNKLKFIDYDTSDKALTLHPNQLKYDDGLPMTAQPMRTRNQSKKLMKNRTVSQMQKYRLQRKAIQKHSRDTQRVLHQKEVRIKRQAETAREKYRVKWEFKINQAAKRKRQLFLDIQASSLIVKYKGIDNLLAEHEKRNMDKEMIYYWVLQYLFALKQHFGFIKLNGFLHKYWSLIQQTKMVRKEEERIREEKRKKEEEEINKKKEQMMQEIDNSRKDVQGGRPA